MEGLSVKAKETKMAKQPSKGGTPGIYRRSLPWVPFEETRLALLYFLPSLHCRSSLETPFLLHRTPLGCVLSH